MGAERARLVVALQGALMRATREFGDDPHFEPYRSRVLATAAALDYVLMLASGTAGVRIAERACRRAGEEARLGRADLGDRGRDGDQVVDAADDAFADRALRFALIALANA